MHKSFDGNNLLLFFSILLLLIPSRKGYSQTIILQDFEVGTSVDYVLKDESNGGTVFSEDVTQAFSAEDYCGRLQVSDLDPADGLDFANVQDQRFFGINDIDGVDSYPVTRDIVSMNWDNVTIDPNKIITISSFIAEGDSHDNLEDWDTQGNFTRIRFEYSFDNTNWTSVFSIVGDPAGDPANTRPVLDSNNDIDETFAEFSGTFESGTNTVVSIRIFIENLTGTDEDIAFDNFKISQDNPNVPVQLSEFQVSLQVCDKVELHWETESEVNNLGFYIERRIGTSDFVPVGFVKGNEFSNSALRYFFTDNLENLANNEFLFYRLQQVDLDGSSEYSYVRSIRNRCDKSERILSVYPNPTSDYLEVTIGDSNMQSGKWLVIRNSAGQELQRLSVKSLESSFRLDLSNYNSGIYHVLLTGSIGETIATKKISVVK